MERSDPLGQILNEVLGMDALGEDIWDQAGMGMVIRALAPKALNRAEPFTPPVPQSAGRAPHVLPD